MIIKNRNISLIYKLLLVLIATFGIYLNSGLPSKFSPKMFLYYTILSNILCLAYFILASIITFKSDKHQLNMDFKGAITMAITVTMLIYWFVLVPAGFVMGDGKELANYIVHLIVPLMVIIDYILFDPKGKISKKAPLTWLLIPFLYYGFTLIAYLFNVEYLGGSRFPYFFIDHTIIGVSNVILSILALSLFFLILGYLIYLFDKQLSKHLTS